MNNLILTILATALLVGCSNTETDISQTTDTYQVSENTVETNITINEPQSMESIQPTAYATISTNKGDMKFKLFGNQTPELTKNFIELAKQGKYENVPFHRVMKDFMIQGGDFELGNGMGGYSYKGEGTGLADEYNENLTHVYGALAWAKSSLPNSIGSQFYIVNGQNGAHFLDQSYSVFGLLIEGSDVLDDLSDTEVKLGAGGELSSPAEELLIQSVTIEEL